MAKLSPKREAWPLLQDLQLLSRGKVRDTYLLSDGNLLVVATDGISIFDFVLNALVPLKGVILNAMNHFWLKHLEQFGFETHFVAAGAAIDGFLPHGMCKDVNLQSRAIVVKRLEMAPVEFVFRNCLTGSALKVYTEGGRVCGHEMPVGLQDGDRLAYTVFTPTSKEEEGHDLPVSAEDVMARFPMAVLRMRDIFQIAVGYAESRGIMIADTKFEAGVDGVLGDEILTPDSSRFWDLREWLTSREAGVRKAPPSLDKELVRQWGKGDGQKINTFDPENPEHVARVHAMEVPELVLAQTTATYRYIFWRLTGRTIEQYLYDVMNVPVLSRLSKKVLVICGSDSDLPAVGAARNEFGVQPPKTIHVMSCHRNPEALRAFIEQGKLKEYDVVIGVGSKALALPGIIDAWAHHYGQNVPVAGVALGEPGSKELLAAQLSIEELPGQPVVIDEIAGQAYSGLSGLGRLFERIAEGELPPPRPRKDRPTKMFV